MQRLVLSNMLEKQEKDGNALDHMDVLEKSMAIGLDTYTRALRTHPNHVELLLAAGRCATDTSNYGLAKQHYRAAVKGIQKLCVFVYSL